nr:hypothetical protein CFP56_59477 [Quercus suber]
MHYLSQERSIQVLAHIDVRNGNLSINVFIFVIFQTYLLPNAFVMQLQLKVNTSMDEFPSLPSEGQHHQGASSAHLADFNAVPPPPLNGESDPHLDPRNPELTSLILTSFHHHHSTVSSIHIPIRGTQSSPRRFQRCSTSTTQRRIESMWSF